MKNRREFLRRAAAAIAGATFCPHPFAEIRKAASDAPKQIVDRKMRGLMVDAGRVPESMEYYRRVVEFCADWGLNTLHFRLADDQGSALRFATVPDLLTHKNAFAPEQLNQLARYAQSLGVDLVPELESFGHTGYITRSPVYAHLLDVNEQAPSEFTGIIPVAPEVQHLFSVLYREAAAIFPSTYLHGGCDEVNWGGSSLSRKALETKTRPQIWAEYLNLLNQMANGLEKQFIVWGDFVLHKEPEILGKLNKSIIIMDWNYRETNSAGISEALQKVRTNGSRGIGAPAMIHYKWGPRAGTEQLRNIDAFAESYLGESDSSSLGVILTNWVPSRYVQSSIWDGFAYAAVAFNEGTVIAQASGFRRFVERHYRAKWNEAWNETIQIIYDSAPCVQQRDTVSSMLPLLTPWSSDEQLSAKLRNRSPRPNPFTKLLSLLGQLRPQVLKNHADFHAFQLCAEYLEGMFWREAVILDQSAKKPLDPEAANLLINGIADRDQSLAEALSQEWDKGRFPNSEAKLEPLFGFQPKDQLLFQWLQATNYSASLANHPEHFHQLLKAAKLM
jgi:hypothetical protein